MRASAGLLFWIACCLQAHSVQAEIQAYWRFESPVSIATDSSSQGNASTYFGATPAGQAPRLWLENDFVIALDAKPDYVEFDAGPSTNLHFFPNGITVEAFIEPAELPLPPDAAGQRVDYILWADDDAYSLRLSSDAEGRTWIHGEINADGGLAGGCAVSVSARFINAVSYTHVAMSFGSSVLRLYLDGVEVGGSLAPVGCHQTVGPVGQRGVLRVGSDETAVGFPNNDRSFRGWIDEVRIADLPLAPEQFLSPPPTELLASSTSLGSVYRFDVNLAQVNDVFGPVSTSATLRGMTLGPDGELFVANQDGGLQVFDWENGLDLGQMASQSGLSNTLQVIVGKDRMLYVGSANPGEIYRVNPANGAVLGVFAAGGGMANPVGLAWGPEGDLYVSDSAGVLRFDGGTGAFVSTILPPVTAPLFRGSIMFASDGTMLVGYYGNGGDDWIATHDPLTGAYLGDAIAPNGPNGAQGNAIDVLADFKVGPNGNIYVASFQGREILEFDRTTGTLINAFASNIGQVDSLLFVPEPSFAAGLLLGVAAFVFARRGAARKDSRRAGTERTVNIAP